MTTPNKLLIESMAETGYTIAMKDQALAGAPSGDWTWANELEPCKELWRKVAIGCLEVKKLYDEQHKQSEDVELTTEQLELMARYSSRILEEKMALASKGPVKVNFTTKNSLPPELKEFVDELDKIQPGDWQTKAEIQVKNSDIAHMHENMDEAIHCLQCVSAGRYHIKAQQSKTSGDT